MGMEKKYIIGAICGFALVSLVIFFGHFTQRPFIKSNLVNTTLLLVTEPENGITPVLSLIANAHTSVDMVIYELEDPQIESALAADERRGVAVHVLLSTGYKGATSAANKEAYDFLETNGVSVRWTSAHFSLTHEKSLLIDGDRAFIMTFNLVAKYYSTGRDFGIFDKNVRDVAAMARTFKADWEGKDISAPNGNDLVWSPGSEEAMVNLIDNAKKDLSIYNEEMADPAVMEALINAGERGVTVDVVMTYSSEWKKAFQELTTAGVHVRTYAEDAPLYIHAKMMIADGTYAFVGSENFSETSLNENRELGIMITDRKMISSLQNIFDGDMNGAAVFSG
jgi:phosphatidylserine/phosphatidylglycerophosphate/cardiolipin synthase-like enzyme